MLTASCTAKEHRNDNPDHSVLLEHSLAFQAKPCDDLRLNCTAISVSFSILSHFLFLFQQIGSMPLFISYEAFCESIEDNPKTTMEINQESRENAKLCQILQWTAWKRWTPTLKSWVPAQLAKGVAAEPAGWAALPCQKNLSTLLSAGSLSVRPTRSLRTCALSPPIFL